MTGHDLEEFAVLKVRKSTMPPGASLVVCYDDGSGEPVLADDMYSEYVVVRREDLETDFLGGESVGAKDDDLEVYYPDEEEG